MLMERLNAAKERVDRAINDENLNDLATCLKKLGKIYAECHSLGPEKQEYHYAEHIKLSIYGCLFAELDLEGDFLELKQRADAELWKAGLRPNKFTNRYIMVDDINTIGCSN